MADIKEYLRESNAIEGVHDDEAVNTAYTAWKELKTVNELTEEAIKSAHGTLLGQRQPDIAGHYREKHVRVGGDVPPSPDEVPELMGELLTRVPETPLEAIDWHVRFEKIHPFTDGNGRIGRLIYLWHCHQLLCQDPIIWRADDRRGYYALFDSEEYLPRLID